MGYYNGSTSDISSLAKMLNILIALVLFAGLSLAALPSFMMSGKGSMEAKKRAGGRPAWVDSVNRPKGQAGFRNMNISGRLKTDPIRLVKKLPAGERRDNEENIQE